MSKRETGSLTQYAGVNKSEGECRILINSHIVKSRKLYIVNA